MADRSTRETIEAVWRIEAPRLMAGLVRLTGDVGLAEDLAQEAFIAAFEHWGHAGVPAKPGAWLMTTARNRALDMFRRHARLAEKHQELARDLTIQEEVGAPDFDAALEPMIEDDMLRLMLIACHPVLSPEARVALTLRMVGGLTTDEIARAFLVPEPTVAQRIVRAKRALGQADVPFEVPAGDKLTARVGSVLAVLYLIFNEGYAASSGDDWLRPALCADALRIGRVLAGLVPDQPEVHGLLALMSLQASRSAARVGPDGEPVLLLDQDRTRWDRLAIRNGLAALARAEALGGARGPYALQAAVAACHARAVRPEDTDWVRIAAIYRDLAEVSPSPVVELNRAVAVAMADGPAAGLPLVDALLEEPALRGYHLLPSVRGDFLFKLGRLAEARAEFERAAGMTRNTREQRLLRDRAAACGE